MDFTWRVGGEAGYGIETAGNLFARMCVKHGLSIFGDREYPSLIRGGHNNFSVRFSDKVLTSQSGVCDVLAALNKLTITEELPTMNMGGVVIHDVSVKSPKNVKSYAVPLSEIAGKHGNARLMMNTVILGSSARLVGFTKSVCLNVIRAHFKRKGEAVIKSNIDAFSDGFDFIKESFCDCKRLKASSDVMLVDGNIAFSIGSLRAGCNFVSAYPMTPATSILEYLCEKAGECGVRAIQAEDEISAINNVIGAGYTGARALTCTSGGGFALMTEGISLAGMSETPVVIVLSQRPGPATGLPTRTEQGDLLFALNAGHGEFTRIILAPGDVNECYDDALSAFNYADMYQTPVIVMTDKHIGASIQSVKPFKDSYVIKRGLLAKSTKALPEAHRFKRYAFTKSGVSPRPLPGVKNLISCSIGDEHDEEGFIVESGKDRKAICDKRLRKHELVSRELSNGVSVYGKGDVTIVGWGSTKGAILESLIELKKLGVNAKFVQVRIISPFPVRAFKKAVSGKVILVEGNRDGQLSKLVNEIGVSHVLFNKYNGRPIHPSEVTSAVRRLVK